MKSLGQSPSACLPEIGAHQTLHQRVRPIHAELAVDEQKLHNVVESLIVVVGGFLDQHCANDPFQYRPIAIATCHPPPLSPQRFGCVRTTHIKMTTG